jgi:signal transduction histidine kinase/DNA-binding response OmpR family regulator
MGIENVDILIRRAQVLKAKDVVQAMALLDDALSDAQKCGYQRGIAVAILEKAACHLRQQRFKQALSGFLEANMFFKQLGDRSGQISCHHEMAGVYRTLGDHPAALQHLLEKLGLFTAIGDSAGVAACHTEIGDHYLLLQNIPEAIDCYKKALKIFEGLKEKHGSLDCYCRLGHAFILEEDDDRALYYLLRAHHALNDGADTDLVVRTLSGLARLYTRQKDYEKALSHFHEALSTAVSGASLPVLIRLKRNLGELYLELTQYDKAIETLTKALERGSLLPADSESVQIHVLLSAAYEKIGDFGPALAHQKRFHELDKQVTSEAVSLKSKALQFRFDLEELRRQKEIAELSDKLKEQFLANVSHEIRTPMNGIIGMTHLLQRTRPTNEQKEYLDAIKDSANNLMVIINDILDFSKINAGKIEFSRSEFSLRELVRGVVQILKVKADEKGLQLNVNIDYRINDLLTGDPIRLNQVLMNLVGNALKFTDKGKVSLEIRLLNTEEQSSRIRFNVTDTGIGIPENRLDSIFESFEQADNNKRRHEGTGLGLTIVRKLVELQGGSIQVKSRPGEGSEFSFEMPFGISSTGSGQLQQEALPAPSNVDLSHLRILVVEDNRINQLLVRKMLKQQGIEQVETAETGSEAIRLLETRIFDLVLMDIQLPEMDGYETTRTIRRRLPEDRQNIPVIALTADASEKMKSTARSAGMDDYLVKPYTPEELSAKLQAFAPARPEVSESEIRDHLNVKRQQTLSRLEALDKFTGGDQELTVQLIEIFLRQLPESIRRLENAVPAKNWPDVHATAHKIKSSIAIFDLKDLRRIIVKIEEYSRDLRKLEEIPSLFSAFRSEAESVMGGLEAELERLRRERVG